MAAVDGAKPLKVWTDPDFNPTECALYYRRVIEFSTPRGTAYGAKYFNL